MFKFEPPQVFSTVGTAFTSAYSDYIVPSSQAAYNYVAPTTKAAYNYVVPPTKSVHRGGQTAAAKASAIRKKQDASLDNETDSEDEVVISGRAAPGRAADADGVFHRSGVIAPERPVEAPPTERRKSNASETFIRTIDPAEAPSLKRRIEDVVASKVNPKRSRSPPRAKPEEGNVRKSSIDFSSLTKSIW